MGCSPDAKIPVVTCSLVVLLRSWKTIQIRFSIGITTTSATVHRNQAHSGCDCSFRGCRGWRQGRVRCAGGKSSHHIRGLGTALMRERPGLHPPAILPRILSRMLCSCRILGSSRLLRSDGKEGQLRRLENFGRIVLSPIRLPIRRAVLLRADELRNQAHHFDRRSDYAARCFAN